MRNGSSENDRPGFIPLRAQLAPAGFTALAIAVGLVAPNYATKSDEVGDRSIGTTVRYFNPAPCGSVEGGSLIDGVAHMMVLVNDPNFPESTCD